MLLHTVAAALLAHTSFLVSSQTVTVTADNSSAQSLYPIPTYERSEKCFFNESLPSIDLANKVWPNSEDYSGQPGEYNAVKIMNSVIRSIWISHPDRVADLVNPDTCDVSLLSEFTQTGEAMPWYNGAAKIAEKDFQSRGQGSLEAAWKLVTNASVDFVALNECTEPAIKAVSAVLVRAPTMPLAVQYNPQKLWGWEPVNGTAETLEFATLNRANETRLDVFLSPGNAKWGQSFSLWDLCKADFVAWGPSCLLPTANETDPVLGAGEKCFGPHVQQWHA